jgi:preprotein translocase SecE subunit
MSTAVEPTTPPQAVPGSAPSLVIGSLLGSVVILAGLVGAGYAAAAVPEATPYLEVARIATYLGTVIAAVIVGGLVANTNPAHGVRGGILLTVSVVIATAFLATAFYHNLKEGLFGPILTGVTLAAGVFAVFRILTSNHGVGWCHAMDEQGWASLNSHKRTQGLHVRRYAMIGILVLGVTGAYALFKAEPFNPPRKAADQTARGTTTPAEPTPTETVRGEISPPFNYRVPFTDKVVPLVPVANLTLPVLIGLATVWLAWRGVNVPPFADFLIATEAEMNKVSWTSRKRLIQDTIVVLVCLLLLTVFLLVIDLFWGWLLSLDFINVLPKKTDTGPVTPGGGPKLDW